MICSEESTIRTLCCIYCTCRRFSVRFPDIAVTPLPPVEELERPVVDALLVLAQEELRGRLHSAQRESHDEVVTISMSRDIKTQSLVTNSVSDQMHHLESAVSFMRRNFSTESLLRTGPARAIFHRG